MNDSIQDFQAVVHCMDALPLGSTVTAVDLKICQPVKKADPVRRPVRMTKRSI